MFDGFPVTNPLATTKPILRPELLPLRARDSGLHPVAIGIALGGYGLFLLASWIGFAFGYQAFIMLVIDMLSLMYFGLLLGLGQDAARIRATAPTRSFAEFLDGRVATATGCVSGQEALVQVAFMPLLLGCTMGVFAAMWLLIQ
jgi:hypothetical protein